MAPADRDRAVAQLVAEAGVTADVRASHRPLTMSELATLAEVEGIDVGAHGVSHASLAMLTDADRRVEIDAGRRTIGRRTGREVTSLAYPFGGPDDATDDVVRAAADLGVELACTAMPGRVHPSTDPLRVPRMIVRDWPADEFESRLLEWMGE